MARAILSFATSILLAGCHPGTSGVAPSAALPACSERPPSDAAAATADAIPALAGSYDLVMVNRVRGWLPTGPRSALLELWPNSPERLAGWPPRTLGRVPGPRPLAGRVHFPAFAGSPAHTLESRGGWPEVEVVALVLYFGSPDAADGGGTGLRITHLSSAGFHGTWASNPGIAMMIDPATGRQLADPQGWFCAYRRVR